MAQNLCGSTRFCASCADIERQPKLTYYLALTVPGAPYHLGMLLRRGRRSTQIGLFGGVTLDVLPGGAGRPADGGACVFEKGLPDRHTVSMGDLEATEIGDWMMPAPQGGLRFAACPCQRWLDRPERYADADDGGAGGTLSLDNLEATGLATGRCRISGRPAKILNADGMPLACDTAIQNERRGGRHGAIAGCG